MYIYVAIQLLTLCGVKIYCVDERLKLSCMSYIRYFEFVFN